MQNKIKVLLRNIRQKQCQNENIEKGVMVRTVIKRNVKIVVGDRISSHIKVKGPQETNMCII